MAIELTDNAADLTESAWGLIANSYAGDWCLATPEWRQAAEQWRDAYHETLSHRHRCSV